MAALAAWLTGSWDDRLDVEVLEVLEVVGGTGRELFAEV